MDTKWLHSFTMEIEEHPFYAAMVIVAFALVILYVYGQATKNNAASTLASVAPAVGVPVENVANTNNSYPTVNPTQHVATIRAKTTSGPDASYDATHTGVPVRSAPSGSATIIYTVPFGGTIALSTNSTVNGTSNQKGGSSAWYQVGNNQYLSAFDVVSVS
jgi:hypothetical protein